MSSENAILSHFSLPVILRQFFCGVVFFLPCLLVWGVAESCRDLMNSDKPIVVGFFVVLCCIVGTIIHHLEKNTYSYFLQGLFCDIKRKRWGVLIVFAVFFCLVSYYVCFWGYIAILSLMLICTLFMFHNRLVETTQKLWVISEVGKVVSKKKAPISFARERYAVLKRLDAWSDHIHCVQSCCFAWIFGLTFAHYLTKPEEEFINILIRICSLLVGCTPWVQPKSAIPLSSFEGWSMVLAMVILFLEACIEWHRFQHVLKITKGFNLPYNTRKTIGVFIFF